MTATVARDVDALALRFGVGVSANPPKIVFERENGPPADEARPLIEALKLAHRANKPAVQEELSRWDESNARERRSAAIGWANQESPPGCWIWCSRYRRGLRKDLDAAFDAIDTAFRETDPRAFVVALVRFGEVIRAAIEAYRKATLPERERAGREYAEARNRTQARTAPQTEEAMA